MFHLEERKMFIQIPIFSSSSFFALLYFEVIDFS